jgi:hypothetical protein
VPITGSGTHGKFGSKDLLGLQQVSTSHFLIWKMYCLSKQCRKTVAAVAEELQVPLLYLLKKENYF